MKQVPIFFFLICLVFPAFAQDSQTTAQEEEQEIIIDLNPDLGYFGDLEEIGIVVKVNREQQKLVDCHGREEECVAAFGIVKERPELEEVYIKQLKDAYAALPDALRKDSLAEAVAEKMRLEFLPYSNLKAEDIQVLAAQEKIQPALASPNSMIVYVELSKTKSQNDELGILSMEFYRPGAEYKNYQLELFADKTAAFIWPISDGQAELEVAAFLNLFELSPVSENSCRI